MCTVSAMQGGLLIHLKPAFFLFNTFYAPDTHARIHHIGYSNKAPTQLNNTQIYTHRTTPTQLNVRTYHSASNTSLGFERIHPPSAIHTPRTPRANLIRRTVIRRHVTISHCIGTKGRDAQTGACFDVEHSVGAAVGWGAGAGEGLGGCVGDGGGRG